jgi:aminoglycoside phosphotransferase (APT) family kinase protein
LSADAAAGGVATDDSLPLDRLDAWLRSEVPALGRVIAYERYPGGFSNLTYHLTTTHGEAVLRRPPAGVGAGKAHDMPREARILSVLELRNIPAPRAIATCEDATVIGAPFYLMEVVRGTILRGPKAPAGYDAGTFARLSERFVDTLVQIHGATPSDPVIGGLGKPMGYVARQVEGWTARWERSRTDDVPSMEALAKWLDANQPSESGGCLVHNDFKYDNLVLDAERPGEIVAVLDWEMATVGDPLMDLGTMLGYWTDPDDPEEMRVRTYGPTFLPGSLSRRQIVERYAERSGRAVGSALFHYVFALFKIAVIVQQIYKRYVEGHTHDPRFADLIRSVRVLSGQAVRALDRGRIHGLAAS